MELVKQHQLAIDIRNIIFHNDLFYLLIYTQIHWNIIVFDKDLICSKTVLEVPVTTDYDIDNFLIGHDGQIIIEFENVIKVFDQQSWEHICIHANGKIKHILYRDNRYYVLVRHFDNFHIHAYDEKWTPIMDISVPDIIQLYGGAKMFISDNIYLIVTHDQEKILYRYTWNMKLLGKLSFNKKCWCGIGQQSIYTINLENGEVEIYNIHSLEKVASAQLTMNDKWIEKITIQDKSLFIVKSRPIIDLIDIDIYKC